MNVDKNIEKFSETETRLTANKKSSDLLVAKIKNRSARIAVFGLGYVGLPMASLFAKAEFLVQGVDLNKNIVKTIMSGKSHTNEPDLGDLIQRTIKDGKLKVTTNGLSTIKTADIIIIAVQTLLSTKKTPNLEYLRNAIQTVTMGGIRGKLIVIVSTIPPRTINDFIVPFLEDATYLTCGKEFHLAYCPERISPGKAIEEFINNTRIVGGYTERCTSVAVELFKVLNGGKVLSTDSSTAEIAKIAENTFRDVNIGYANELALICEQNGVDIIEVTELANTHPRVNIHKSGCGVGGACLTRDPYYLLSFGKKDATKITVINSARKMNDYMPIHTVEKIIDEFEKLGKKVKNAKIAILGLTYKGNINDTRNSPVEQIIQILLKYGANVVAFDPHTTETFGAKMSKSLHEALTDAECIVIAADHEFLKKLDFSTLKSLLPENAVIFDCKQIIDYSQLRGLGFIFAGIGRKSLTP